MLSFNLVWNNYPSDDPCVDPKTGATPAGFENQCAIRLGFALERSGVNFSEFRGLRCVKTPPKGGMVASAQALADILIFGMDLG